MGIIYIAENKLNGKSYIGKTICTLDKRKREHSHSAKYKYRTLFHKALRKYGMENFNWRVLWEGDEDKLDEKECFFIEENKTHYISGHGYNMSYGGESYPRGFMEELWKDEEFRLIHSRKTSEAVKRSWKNKETRRLRTEKIREARIREYRNDKEYYNTISKHLKRQAIDNWKDTKKRENTIRERSNRYRFEDNIGRVYEIEGGQELRNFCDIMGLKYYTVYRRVKENKGYNNWKISITRMSKRYG